MNVHSDEVLYFYVIRGSEIDSEKVEEWSGVALHNPFQNTEQVEGLLETICEEDGLDINRVAFVTLNRL